MSRTQRFFRAILPRSWFAAMEADSKKWMVQCGCGHEVSIWDIGGIKYRAYGESITMRRCPKCGISKHRVYKKSDPAPSAESKP